MEDKTANIKSDLKMLVMNRLWKVLFFAAILTLAFVAMKSAVTVHFFKYYVGDDGTPYFLFMDRSTLFMTLGMLALIPGCACTKLLTHRFEKKTLMIWLSLLNAVLMLIFFLIPPDQYWTMMTVNILGSFLAGSTPALVWAMYRDIADYGEWKFKRRTTGLVFSAAQFAQKFGLTIGAGLSGWLLASFGFIVNTDQTDTSLLEVCLVFTIIPACLALMNVFVLRFYNLRDTEVQQIEIDLEERRSLLLPGTWARITNNCCLWSGVPGTAGPM